MLGTTTTRQVLQNEVVDADGNPRLVVIKILAFIYRDAGFKAWTTWQTFLDSKIAASGGDTKACWMLGKAFTESVSNPSGNPKIFLRGKEWMDSALATATSASFRLVVLQGIC